MSNDQTIKIDEQAIPKMRFRMSDVYISYKCENTAFVTRLYDELTRHNISAWVDLSKLHKEVGEEYTEHIHQGINGSFFFLLIYTKEIENSDFIINQELGYAISRGKTILFHPLESFDKNKSRISPFINKIKWIGWGRETDTLSSEEQSIFIIRMWLQYMLGKLTFLGNYQKLLGNSDFYSHDIFQIYVTNKSFNLTIPRKQKQQLIELGFIRKDKVHEIEKHLKRVMPEKNEIKKKLFKFIEGHHNIYPLQVIYKKLQRELCQTKYEKIELPEQHEFGVEEFVMTVTEMIAYTFITDLKEGKTLFNATELGVFNILCNNVVDSEESCANIQLYYSDYFTYRCVNKIYQILSSIDETPFRITSIQEINTLSPFFCTIGLGGFLVADSNGGTSLLWSRYTNYKSATDIWHFSYDEKIDLLFDGVKDEKGQLLIGKDNTVHIDIESLLNRAVKEAVGATISDLKQDSYGIFEVGIIGSERLEIEIISRASIKTDPTESPMGKIRKLFDNTDMGFQALSKMQFLPLNDDDLLLGKMLSPESYAIFKRIQQQVRNKDCWHENEIFISYSRHDSSIVHPFVNKIQDVLKIKCWIDMEGIESGDQFEDVIIEAIDRSKIVLFMLSDNSIKSNWTKKEVYYAEGEQKRIVPVVIDNKGLRGWFKFHFGNIDYIDSNSPELVSKLIQNLKDWLKIR